MLVALIPANSLTKSGGRKAAIGALQGAIEQSRANAIRTGRAAYVAFPTFSGGSASTVDRYHCKAYAVFEDDPGNPTTPKQVTNWKALTAGVALRAKSGAPGAITDLPLSTSLNPPATFTFAPEATATAAFRCIKFNANGEIESPAGNVTLTVFEGHVNGATELATSKNDASGNPAARESLKIAHLTGRVEATQ